MSTIIDQLIKEHREIEELFEEYESDPVSVFPRLKEAIEMHTKQEELILYPATHSFASEETHHAKKEHDEADMILHRLSNDIHNIDILNALKESITHHVKEEEEEYFPKVEDNLTKKKLTEMAKNAKRLRE